MEIKKQELIQIFEMLLEYLDKKNISSIMLEKDYYWNIPSDSWLEPYKEPEELDIGQLTDDWKYLLECLQKKNEPIGFAFVWLSNILRYIGEITV